MSLTSSGLIVETLDFTRYATRSVLSGPGDELIDLVKTNVTRRLFT
jgi:hypothetical protein